MSGSPRVCGDCGAYDGTHFPNCPTLQERTAGVEVVPSYSDQSPRRCPRCGSAMTRNHDQQSGTTTDNCTGGACGATLTVAPMDPGGMPPDPKSPAAAFDAIAAMPGARVIEEPYPGEGELCPSCLQPIRTDTVEQIYQYGEHFFHKPCWDDRRGQMIP